VLQNVFHFIITFLAQYDRKDEQAAEKWCRKYSRLNVIVKNRQWVSGRQEIRYTIAENKNYSKKLFYGSI